MIGFPASWSAALLENRQVGEHTVMVFDYDQIILCMVRDGDSVEDAEQWLHYNTLRSLSYMGDGAPWIVKRLHGVECLDDEDEIVDVGGAAYRRLR